MNISDKIVRQLSTVYPQRLFSSHVIPDPISFQPRVIITIDGRQTVYGFYPHLVKENTQKTEDQFVAEFVKNIVLTLDRDFKRP